MKEIPLIIKTNIEDSNNSKIPKNIIQTYRTNHVHDFIYDNIVNMLNNNPDFNYYMITDDIGIDLIKTYFDTHTLEAYNKLNVGAAKGDFLRYIAMYIYGGVYLDLDSSIEINLSSFINPDVEYLFIMDGCINLIQWCFMSSSKNPIILKIIEEMVKRIHANEHNIFLATGPTLFTDVVFNLINNKKCYNVTQFISRNDRFRTFMDSSYMNGIILFEGDKKLALNEKFLSNMKGYQQNMLYSDTNKRYIPTFGGRPTPNLYK